MRALSLILSAFASSATAEGVMGLVSLDELKRLLPGQTWRFDSAPITEADLTSSAQEARKEDEAAVARMVSSFSTTYEGAHYGAATSETSAISVHYIYLEGKVILARIFVSTADPTFNRMPPSDFDAVFSALAVGDLKHGGNEVISRVWDAYMHRDPSTSFPGWIQVSTVENEAWAWGVPPDFVEIVVSSRTDCAFMPVQLWVARQICP